MNITKILLLHGPILSNGINFLSSEMHKSPDERKNIRANFDSSENIRLLSILYRFYGFKVIYSGWQEDEEWLTYEKRREEADDRDRSFAEE